jgi:pilus assembly protein Flp/PilA
MKKRESGQGLVSYALILFMVANVVMAMLLLIGPAIDDKFQSILCSIDSSLCTQSEDSLSLSEAYMLSDGVMLSDESELDDVLDKVNNLKDRATHQEVSINDGFDLAIDSFEVIIDILLSHSENTDNFFLFESLTQIQQELQAGNYEDALSSTPSILSKLDELPYEVIVNYIKESSPKIIDSCQKFNSGFVPTGIMDETKLAVDQLPDSHVGKDEALRALGEVRKIINVRNEVIVEATEYQSEILTSFISTLKNFDEKDLAANLTEKSKVCVIPVVNSETN